MDGYINEIVEHCNFHSAAGETFDDYLIALRELAKTCRFCFNTCMQKIIRNQVIEGLLDGNTVEDLLQESDLTLTTAIKKCRSREGAKQNWSQKLSQELGIGVVATLQYLQLSNQQGRPRTCQGCGGVQHKGGHAHCPAYDKACSIWHKVGHFARVYRSKQGPHQQTPINDSPDLQPMQFVWNHHKITTYSFTV